MLLAETDSVGEGHARMCQNLVLPETDILTTIKIQVHVWSHSLDALFIQH